MWIVCNELTFLLFDLVLFLYGAGLLTIAASKLD